MTNGAPNPVTGFSIIIVNYNSGELIGKCIESIFTCIDKGFEIIVYDNASTDGSIAALDPVMTSHHELRLISGTENLGFAKANNLAAQHASGLFYHFLNPDIVVNPSLNDAYQNILQNKEKSIFVTNLTDSSGTIQKNRHLVPRIGNIFRKIIGNKDVAYWNLGASLIIHCDAFLNLGGWPEDYFMYAEDLDFFYSAYRKKIPVRYLGISLLHLGKGVTQNIWTDEQRALIIERSFLKFYRKYNAGWEYLLVRPVQLIYILFNEPRMFTLYFKVFFQSILSHS
jgi:GT2 family glycosyltransferase